jgi:hypothetical protein
VAERIRSTKEATQGAEKKGATVPFPKLWPLGSTRRTVEGLGAAADTSRSPVHGSFAEIQRTPNKWTIVAAKKEGFTYW